MSTAIPYANLNAKGESWSPVTGCSKGCPWCWSRAVAHRFKRSFAPAFHLGKLGEPLHWRQPRRVLVGFNSDLFDHAFTDLQIAAVFGVMAMCPQHRFLVLTKQAKRMAAWFRWAEKYAPDDGGEGPGRAMWQGICESPDPCGLFPDVWDGEDGPPIPGDWPLPNVLLGVSTTNQADADERIPHLLRCPAAVRWVSAEPLLGPLRIFNPGCPHPVQTPKGETMPGGGIDWIVAGAQSGAGAPPVQATWAFDLRSQCARARVAFMWKDPTGFPPLDGVVHNAMPVAP